VPPREPLVTLVDASFGFDHSAGPNLVDVSLAVHPGMRLLVLGPAGSGKSALLAGIAGRLRPLAGTRSTARRLQMLFWDTTVRDDSLNIENESPLDFLVRHGGGDDASCEEILSSISIDPHAARRPLTCLSSGERTLLTIATLAAAPKHLLIFDEPAAFLGHAFIDVVTEALAPSRWPGALVFTSSTWHCCEALQPTHIGHIAGDHLHVVQRPLQKEDFVLIGGVPNGCAPSPPMITLGGGTATEPSSAEELWDDDAMLARATEVGRPVASSLNGQGSCIQWQCSSDSMAATVAMSMAMLREMGVPREEAFRAFQAGTAALSSVLAAESDSTGTPRMDEDDDDEMRLESSSVELEERARALDAATIEVDDATDGGGRPKKRHARS